MKFERKLLIAGVAYVIFIFSIAGACLKQDFYLVADDYYDQEINYQSHLDKINNASELTIPVKLEITSDHSIAILFPKNVGDIQGVITFYRPSNGTKDFQVPISKDNDYKQFIGTQHLTAGLWKVQVDWDNYDRSFYNEFTVVL